MERINNLRDKIDEIDKQMAKLFEQRMLLVKESDVLAIVE